jgi:hypothetical protein
MAKMTDHEYAMAAKSRRERRNDRALKESAMLRNAHGHPHSEDPLYLVPDTKQSYWDKK